MVAPGRIRCKVIAIPVSRGRWNPRAVRARDLLPWADPYVAGLIRKLQNEVRQERLTQALASDRRIDWSQVEADALDSVYSDPTVAEAEVPWDDQQFQFEPWDDSADYPDRRDDETIER